MPRDTLAVFCFVPLVGALLAASAYYLWSTPDAPAGDGFPAPPAEIFPGDDVLRTSLATPAPSEAVVHTTAVQEWSLACAEARAVIAAERLDRISQRAPDPGVRAALGLPPLRGAAPAAVRKARADAEYWYNQAAAEARELTAILGQPVQTAAPRPPLPD